MNNFAWATFFIIELNLILKKKQNLKSSIEKEKTLKKINLRFKVSKSKSKNKKKRKIKSHQNV